MQRRRASRREAELDEEGKRTQQRVTESQERLAIEGQEDETVRGAEEEEKMTKKGSSKGLLEIEDVKPAGSEQPPNSTKNTYVVPAAPQGIPTAFGGDMVPVPRTPIQHKTITIMQPLHCDLQPGVTYTPTFIEYSLTLFIVM